MGSVKERIDHIDINTNDQIAYVAALGNNTLEIVDLKKRQGNRQHHGIYQIAGRLFRPGNSIRSGELVRDLF